jgi:hypothetical protein
MLLRLQTFRRPRGTTPCQELKLVSVADDGLTVVDRIVTVARATVDREEQNLLEAAKFGGPLCDGSYGYRPRRAAQAAVARVEKSIVYGKTRVIDVDPAAYLDAATYCPPIHGWLGKSSG